MTIPWLRGAALFGAAAMAATVSASTSLADQNSGPPTLGVRVDDESSQCTAGFAAQSNDGNYYLLTSGHCDAHDGSMWTYGNNVPLGKMTASENEGDTKDAAMIRIDPGVARPNGDVGGQYPVRDVLSLNQLKVGMPFCKMGSVTGETCGVIKSQDGGVIEASVYSLSGDSGSPGFVKNPDGTVSAAGLLMSSPVGDDHTSYFAPVYPLLGQWGLRIPL